MANRTSPNSQLPAPSASPEKHPLIDGNKRALLRALVAFLRLNGIDVLVAEAEAVLMIRGLAAGEIDESGLTRWLRDNGPKA